MHVTRLDANPVEHSPLEQQVDKFWTDVNRLAKELPFKSIITARQQAMAETRNPYANAYDITMWNEVGNPYHDRNLEGKRRLFLGINRKSGEVLQVLDRYHVVTANPSENARTEWHILEDNTEIIGGVLDARLVIGRAALTVALETSKLRFANPSRSAGLRIEGDQRISYEPNLIKNLYDVIRVFDQKYKHLEVAYSQPDTKATIISPIAGIAAA